MVAHRGLRPPEGLHEGAGADLSLGLGSDQAEEPQPGRVAQSREAPGQVAGFGFMDRGKDRGAATLQTLGRDLSSRQLTPRGHSSILTPVDGPGKMLISTSINAVQGELKVAGPLLSLGIT